MAKLVKKVSGGKFAENLDKEKDVQSGDIIQIISEAREVETKFGTKKVVDVRLPNEQVRSLFLNQSSENNIVDKYGDDYINKPMKVLLGITGTGKTMLILKG